MLDDLKSFSLTAIIVIDCDFVTDCINDNWKNNSCLIDQRVRSLFRLLFHFER